MGLFDSFFGSKTDTVKQEALLTPEQKQALSALSQIGQTGSYGDINLGESYSGSLGDFNTTGMENLAGNNLYNLINSGTPQGINTARGTLTGLANNKFNPDDPSSGYAAYSRMVERENQKGLDTLNRDAAITGDRFSSSLGRQKADLQAQMSDILASKLGDLYNTAQDRSLSASNSLVGLEGTNEGINQNRISAGFNYGGLERTLKNAEATAKYNEYQRSRSEKLKQIDTLGSVMGQQFTWGVPEITKKSPSTFMSILGEINPAIGSYNTHKYGYTTKQSSLSDAVKAAMAAMNPGGSAGFGG